MWSVHLQHDLCHPGFGQELFEKHKCRDLAGDWDRVETAKNIELLVSFALVQLPMVTLNPKLSE